MGIEFQCETCGTTMRVPNEHAGKQAKCPTCQSINSIPSGEWIPNEKPLPPQTVPPQKNIFSTNPYAPSNYVPRAEEIAYPEPHRGNLLVALGILAVIPVCNFLFVPGIMAWVMGRNDLKAIDEGRMDPEGRGMCKAGMIMGIVGTMIPVVLVLLYFAILALVLIAGIIAAIAT